MSGVEHAGPPTPDQAVLALVRDELARSGGDVGDLLVSASGDIADDQVLRRRSAEARAELIGAGPLQELLQRPGVTDVLVNAPDEVWVDDGDGLRPSDVRFADDAAVRRLAQRLATSAGRRLDDAYPFADAVLADGTRMHAVLPPITEHPTVSLRVLRTRRWDIAALVAAGCLPDPLAQTLHEVVRVGIPVLVTGGTGTGKTTLLGCVLAAVPRSQRLLLIEDTPELTVEHPHVVRLVARAANVEGAGAVPLAALVRHALRMRPDRIVVGEFRGPEMVDLLVALNTGHEGGAATMHANSATDVPARLVALAGLAGVDASGLERLVAGVLDVVVHLRRRGGRRAVEEVAMLQPTERGLRSVTAWSADAGNGPGARLLADRVRQRDGRECGILP